MAGEVAEDGFFLSSVDGDVAAEGIMGALSYIGNENTAGAGAAEVVFEGAGFGGAGIALEETHGDMLGSQRLVDLIEQVFVGEVHFILVLSIEA